VEQEFLKAAMLAVASPDSLLPVEIELAERLIAHWVGSFKVDSKQQPDAVYWIDLAQNQPPTRLVRTPDPTPTLRYFAPGAALNQIRQLVQIVRQTNAVPSGISLGGTYEPQVVVEVLEHLAMCWSTQAPERKAARHRVKSRVTITHGFDGVLSAIDPGGDALFDPRESRAGSSRTSAREGSAPWCRSSGAIGCGSAACSACSPRAARTGSSAWCGAFSAMPRRRGQSASKRWTFRADGAGQGGHRPDRAQRRHRNGDLPRSVGFHRRDAFAPSSERSASQPEPAARAERQDVPAPADRGMERGEDYDLLRCRIMVRDPGE